MNNGLISQHGEWYLTYSRRNFRLFIYWNTCWAPHLRMSSKRFTMATMALFLAPGQTHCVLVVCHSKWVTIFDTARCEEPPTWLQRCLVVTRLAPRETAAVSAQFLRTPYNHAPVYSVTFFEAAYIGCIQWLAVTWHLSALFAEWPGSVTCCCGNTGVERPDTEVGSQGIWFDAPHCVSIRHDADHRHALVLTHSLAAEGLNCIIQR